MCGIAGIAGTLGRRGGRADADVRRDPAPRSRRLRHVRRGRVGLGMRRLSIIRPGGGPSACSPTRTRRAGGPHGEITTTGVRRELRGARHRSAQVGYRGPRPPLRGRRRRMPSGCAMFAFAIWDRRRARAPGGARPLRPKPLSTTERGGRLTFAPRSRALLADYPIWPGSRRSPSTSLTLRFVSAADTFFEQIRALPPAISWCGRAASSRRAYWT